MGRVVGMRLILALALAFAAANVARAENFVFETSVARLVIGSDGVISSLIEKQNGSFPFCFSIRLLITPSDPITSLATLVSNTKFSARATFAAAKARANARISLMPTTLPIEHPHYHQW